MSTVVLQSKQGKPSQNDKKREKEEKSFESKIQKQKLDEIEARNQKRWYYANTFLTIAVLFIVFVCILITVTGYNNNDGFRISDTVSVALLGTALSTILAPAYLLAKYLFTHHDEDNNT